MFRFIQGMSKTDSAIRERLESDALQLDRHLVKLILYPDAQERMHWAKEIWNFVNIVDKRKSNNKYPKEQFNYNALSCHNDILDNIVWQVKCEMKRQPKPYHDQYILRKVESYQAWLAKKLSTQGAVNSDQVYKALMHFKILKEDQNE